MKDDKKTPPLLLHETGSRQSYYQQVAIDRMLRNSELAKQQREAK